MQVVLIFLQISEEHKLQQNSTFTVNNHDPSSSVFSHENILHTLNNLLASKIKSICTIFFDIYSVRYDRCVTASTESHLI